MVNFRRLYRKAKVSWKNWKIISSKDMNARFTNIYKYNYWGGKESVSGAGSSLVATENLRAELPLLFKKLGTQVIFDAPCGDFHWMKYVMTESDKTYIGGDIVAPLIKRNQKLYGNSKIHFLKHDITTDSFPNADIWICRHCLFHLSFEHIQMALDCFLHSKIPYILTTTHLSRYSIINTNIVSGDFRLIDLFAQPFLFPEPVAFRCDDFVAPDPPMEICLWHRDQIAIAVESMKERVVGNIKEL